MKITPTSLTLNQLFSATNEQYVIPPYQRRYSWQEKQIYELLDDVELLEGSDTHLFGNIVCLTGSHTAGINQLELVDGQQRLTTISILLECVRRRLESDKKSDLASEVARLLSAKTMDGKHVPKILLDSIDGKEFMRLVGGDVNGDYRNECLRKAFSVISSWVAEESFESLSAFIYRLQNQALVIRLDVSDAKDAFKLFETINNRGLRLSPTDIIKNFLLGNAARFGEEPLERARETWAKLIRNLDGTNPDNFFRYFLTASTRRRVTTGYVVTTFKDMFMKEVKEAATLPERHFYLDEEQEDDEEVGNSEAKEAIAEQSEEELKKVTFRQFLSRLVLNSKVYGELVLAKTGNSKVDRRLCNLRMIKAAQTFGFLMHLRAGGCSDKDFLAILALTESFVLRRHVCRERSNDTERLFATLCGVDCQDPVDATRHAYREFCPSDDKFKDEFSSVSFTSNIIDRARYCLEVIELSSHGNYDELKVLDAESVHVEHIIPQKIKTKRAKDEFGDWVDYLGEKAEIYHPKYVSLIGNLTLFAGPLNIGASNNPFSKKKAAYRESSILITKELAGAPNFRFQQVKKRSERLAELAVKLWPTP